MQPFERRPGGQVPTKLEKRFRGGEPPNWGGGPGNRREPYLKRRSSGRLVVKPPVGRGTEGRGQDAAGPELGHRPGDQHCGRAEPGQVTGWRGGGRRGMRSGATSAPRWAVGP